MIRLICHQAEAPHILTSVDFHYLAILFRTSVAIAAHAVFIIPGVGDLSD